MNQTAAIDEKPATNGERARRLHPSSTHSRRAALRLMGGAGLGVIAGACSVARSPNAESGSATTASRATSEGTSAGSCSTIPEETAGPFPGDGSNGANVLSRDGVVRRDIRSSFGASTTTAAGVPLTIALQVVDRANGCRPLAGSSVYVWHCDRGGLYSMYSPGVENENYLRGIQETGDDGGVEFTSIFPGCYSGRWPHIHFEVYPSVTAATAASSKLATSQLALPQDVCNAVYATPGYSASAGNLSQVSLASDMVFRDGASLETPSVTGHVSDGYLATLIVPV